MACWWHLLIAVNCHIEHFKAVLKELVCALRHPPCIVIVVPAVVQTQADEHCASLFPSVALTSRDLFALLELRSFK